MNRRELAGALDTLRRTPIAVARLLDGLDPPQLTWRPPSGHFSLLENICHLRDIEQDGFLLRVRRLRFEANPVLEDLDGDRLAVERRYNEQPLRPAFDGFAQARKLTLRALEELTEQDLDRAGTMQNVGPVTLGSLVRMIIDHDAGHLAAMKELRERLLAGAG